MIPSSSSPGAPIEEKSLIDDLQNKTAGLCTQWQQLLDRISPLILYRWVGTAVLVFVYVLRVWLVEGFHVVSYAVSIYGLTLLIAFLSPQWDPDLSGMPGEGGALPTKQDDEFRPFIRSMPEFKFWLSFTKAFFFALVATFFRFLDIPVFWPILLLYFVGLFGYQMKKQIQHMITHRYLPWTVGKPKHSRSAASSSPSSASS